MGGFRIFPTLDLSGSYDSNIFRQPNDQSDYFLTLAPVLRVQSDWDRHFLEFYTGATNYDYADHHAENLTDWRVGGDGRLDIGSSSILFANGFHGEMHEPLSHPPTTCPACRPSRTAITRPISSCSAATAKAISAWVPASLSITWTGWRPRPWAAA